MIAKKGGVEGVRFEAGGEDQPLVWKLHIEGPVRDRAGRSLRMQAAAGDAVPAGRKRWRTSCKAAWVGPCCGRRAAAHRRVYFPVWHRLPIPLPQAEYVVGTERRPCPYAGRIFEATITCPPNYPFAAPTVTFAPNVLYHPQVETATGRVCADEISKVFGPTKNMMDLAGTLKNFLMQPNIDEAPQVRRPAAGEGPHPGCLPLHAVGCEPALSRSRAWPAPPPPCLPAGRHHGRDARPEDAAHV